MSGFQESVDSKYILYFYHSKEPKQVNPFQEMWYKNEACCLQSGGGTTLSNGIFTWSYIFLNK